MGGSRPCRLPRSGPPRGRGPANVPNVNIEAPARTSSEITGRTVSKALSDPNRWFPNTPPVSVARPPTPAAAATRTAVPNSVSPSRNGFENSVLSPYRKTSAPMRGGSCACTTVCRQTYPAMRGATLYLAIARAALFAIAALAIDSFAYADETARPRPAALAPRGWTAEVTGEIQREAWNYNLS